ncbi:MAG: hypothetical protein F9K40_07040 [Kofleriaceae bacterium]|nr:MAG: hypothetical protein F9K40_07040 [Kofleriaceae bacterium]MBZ0238398.1 hypothetical protein [Kofleriaceae bacterium]
MRKRSGSVASLSLVVGACILPATLGGCKDKQLKGAQAEVQPHKIKVTMPTVPSFEVPKPHPDGSHTVKEMRVQGNRYIKETLSIKGYIVWQYDCATAIRQPDEDDAAVAKRIEENPTLCRRPAFYLGDTPDTPVERAVWVVEVPREMTKQEKKNLPKEMVDTWPAVPPYKVGDEVVATGQWMHASPHGESNTDGLLVYQSFNNITQNWQSPAPIELAEPSIRPPAH